ncbi:ribose-phosphate diphosphokinase [Thalassomonas actiniarum]|uniref:Ribose-phosphate diphosphokinase n=1 Tax=Thalassomonas actiniarum TaxID=485447 RepID=A0AAE9YVE1_9GAMM|nr:ribose-phosphate diphosphokinase [Thalassomonas actiniarum]
MVLGFDDYWQGANTLAAELDLPCDKVAVHHFPDGESKITVPAELPETVIICRSLHRPNEKLLELILAAETARGMGAKRLLLAAPYLCYMRQDIAFQPGEAVSQKIIGQLLAQYFDDVITVDPHLHRIDTLKQAVPATHALSLKATEPMAQYLRRNFTNPVIVGPDEESRQWVSAVAAIYDWEFYIAEKQRFDDHQVQVSLQALTLDGRDLVIIDDIASTGGTLVQAARQLRMFNPASLSVIVTHAFFIGNAMTELKKAGVHNIWSSDAIPHQSNVFSVITVVAKAVKVLLA